MVLLGSFALASPASAQTTNSSGQALEIAPPVLILSANPGQTVKTSLSLRNVSTGSLLVSSQLNDFTAQGEAGIPKLLLDQAAQTPYSIKDWISSLPELTMAAKQLKNLPVTITVPAGTSPGGYYGVVRFTATPPELKQTGVALSASLGALIFLRVNGNVTEKLSVASFSVNQNGKDSSFFESAPINFSIRVQNTGNLFEQPTGIITITDMFGKNVANVNVNVRDPKYFVLSGSTRKFDNILDSQTIGDRILFGHYKASMKLTYGVNNQVLTKSIEFWVIPYRLIGVIVVGLVVIIVTLIFLIKRYNRFIVSRARQTRRNK